VSERVVRLDEVCEINPRAPKGMDDDEHVSFLPMAAVSEDGRIEYQEARKAGEVKKGYTYFERGDVLLAKITPCFENGKAARTFDLSTHRGFGSSEFHVIRPAKEVLADYIFYILWNTSFREVGALNMTGSAGQKRVPADFLKRLEIPLPPLDEQRRIAAILDKADALRQKRKQAIVLLDSMTHAIFLEMFGEPTENPRGFPVQDLGKIGSLERGVSKHRPRNDPTLLGGDYPLIQTGDVSNSGGYIRAYCSTYSEQGLRQSKLWPAGTLCITIAANIARTGILTFPACFPDSVVGFQSPCSNLVEYVRVWLSFLQKTLEQNAPTVAQKNINLEILRNLPIAVPPKELLHIFGRRISFLAKLEREQQRSASYFEANFTSLQSRAFSGQL